MIPFVQGHLFVRVLDEDRTMSLSVELEGQVTTSKSSAQLVVKVPEYFGPEEFTITLRTTTTTTTATTGKKRKMGWIPFVKPKREKGSATFSLGHSAPRRKSLAHYQDWKAYWPKCALQVGTRRVEIAMLFVPSLPPERCAGGFTELHKAAFLGDAELLRYIIAHSHYRAVDLAVSRLRDSFGLTALDLCVMRGHSLAVKAIVDEADRLVWGLHQTPDQRTALHRAVLSQNDDSLVYLAEYYGKNRIPLAVNNNHHALVIDAQDCDGYTAIMMACEHSAQPPLVRGVVKLLEFGAKLELCNPLGESALLIACRTGAIALALVLLQQCDDVHSPPTHRTCLARPNLANAKGERSLDLAAGLSPCPGLLQALLRACAIPGLRRPNGFTALHCAAQAGIQANCQVLVDWLDEHVAVAEARMESNPSEYLGWYPGSAYAQSKHFTLYRDHQGRLASQVAAQVGHHTLATYLSSVETRHLERMTREEGKL
ncbi:hypothetical protein BASA81_010991 [Batrachochytrium salamandrivorans]|nr:hypothetical protein BASA81_010991 [Batrachochytrium salamandrivorans]